MFFTFKIFLRLKLSLRIFIQRAQELTDGGLYNRSGLLFHNCLQHLMGMMHSQSIQSPNIVFKISKQRISKILHYREKYRMSFNKTTE